MLNNNRNNYSDPKVLRITMSAPRLNMRGRDAGKRKNDEDPHNLTPHKRVQQYKTGPSNKFNITSQALDSEYKKLVKEYGKKEQSRSMPNLAKARDRRTTIDKDGFISPKKTQSQEQAQAGGSSQGTPTQNSFSSLENTTQNEVDMDQVSEHTPSPVNSRPVSPAGKTKQGPNKKTKPPPVHIDKFLIKDTIQLLTSKGTKKGSFQIRQSLNTPDTTTVMANDMDTYTAVKAILNEAKAHYHTYTPKDIKPKSIILKGIKGNFTCEEIQAEIEDLKPNNVVILKVTKLIPNKKKPSNYHFFIQISHDSPLAELTKINSLSYQKARWEKLQKEVLFQCKNCQRLGHASTNCNLPFRCVKCGQSHPPKECTLTNTDNRELLKCANCELTGHPANYRGCPFYKHSMKKVKENKAQKEIRIQEKIIRATRIVKPSLSFAAAAAASQEGTSRYPEPTAAQNSTRHHIPPPEHPTRSRHQENESAPSWVAELRRNLRDDLKQMITTELTELKTQTSKNSARIDQIMEILKIDNDQE